MKLQIVQPPKPAPPIIVRDGIVMIPSSLKGIVLGVFGLDNRPIGTPGGAAEEVELQVTAASSLPTPPQIAALYKFPKPAGTSKGQVIALMQFGGGYDPNHPKKYFSDLGVIQPTLIDVGVAGSANTPGHPVYDNEVTLDIGCRLGGEGHAGDYSRRTTARLDRGRASAVRRHSPALHRVDQLGAGARHLEHPD